MTFAENKPMKKVNKEKMKKEKAFMWNWNEVYYYCLYRFQSNVYLKPIDML